MRKRIKSILPLVLAFVLVLGTANFADASRHGRGHGRRHHNNRQECLYPDCDYKNCREHCDELCVKHNEEECKVKNCETCKYIEDHNGVCPCGKTLEEREAERKERREANRNNRPGRGHGHRRGHHGRR